jgi:hypothetical protein
LVPQSGGDEYEGDWVYVSMFSHSGCIIGVTIKFTDEERLQKQQRRAKLTSVDYNSDSYATYRREVINNEAIVRNIQQASLVPEMRLLGQQ